MPLCRKTRTRCGARRQRDTGSCPGNSIGYPHGRQFGRKWRTIHPNGGRELRFKAVWATVRAGMEENSPERWNDGAKRLRKPLAFACAACFELLASVFASSAALLSVFSELASLQNFTDSLRP